ncbi:MAG: hypothetical protein JW702_04175 [Clostridiales bacterium]|nr:hypothetical protein [Clostridiales bacterium]
MNKMIVVLIFCTVIMSGISGLLFYQLNVVQTENNEFKITNDNLLKRNSELEDFVKNFSYKILITDFRISGLKSVDGWIFESNVYVRLQNFGINNVTGLTLTLVGFGDENLATSMQLDTIYIGEEKEVLTKVQWVYGSQGTSSATLKLNDLVLSQKSLSFSDVY